MSRFKELCQAYTEDRKFYLDNYNKVCKFIGDFLSQFVNYLELPKENIYFIPLNHDPEANQQYTLYGATHLNADKYFHTGVVFVIEQGKGISPKKRTRLEIKTKISENVISVKFASEEREFIYQESNYADKLEEVHNFVFNLLFSNTKDHFKRWLSDSNKLIIEEAEYKEIN